MTTTSVPWMLWIPRVLGILAGLFLGLFALDAFSEGKPLAQALPDFIIHLVPGAVLLAVVALSWRWPWVSSVTALPRRHSGEMGATLQTRAGRPMPDTRAVRPRRSAGTRRR